MEIWKITYEYTDRAFMLVEAENPDEAASRLAEQFSKAGVAYKILGISLLQETSPEEKKVLN